MDNLKEHIKKLRYDSILDMPLPGHKNRFKRKLQIIHNKKHVNENPLKLKGKIDLPQWATSTAAAIMIFVLMLPFFASSSADAKDMKDIESTYKIEQLSINGEKYIVLTKSIIREAIFEMEMLGISQELETEQPYNW